MATMKKGMLTPAPEWWKHLREAKRTFWKGERSAAKKVVREESNLDAGGDKNPEASVSQTR